MDFELLGIGLFGLFGCLLFILFLSCFQQAFNGGDLPTRSLDEDNMNNNSTIMALHSSSNCFVKKLSRSLTAERSAFIMPSIVREFSFAQIEAATGKFSRSSMIKQGHSGDVYRGVLEGGEVVVIKRILINPNSNIIKCNCEKDFYLAEMEIYGKVLDQSFLVPMLGQCLENDEKFLVYEYMPYGDLATILAKAKVNHTIKTLQSQEGDSGYDANGVDQGRLSTGLTWPVRMRIARGVAEALVYLHHASRPPLSHRNIQGSSILLNEDFEVKLGSLSDAQKLEGGEVPAYDIYCFGKLLLDLISGLDISGNYRDEHAQAWVHKCFYAIGRTQLFSIKEYLVVLVDRNLELEEHHLLEIIEVAKLAKHCMEPTTLQRPTTMKGVLEMLPTESI